MKFIWKALPDHLLPRPFEQRRSQPFLPAFDLNQIEGVGFEYGSLDKYMEKYVAVVIAIVYATRTQRC